MSHLAFWGEECKEQNKQASAMALRQKCLMYLRKTREPGVARIE